MKEQTHAHDGTPRFDGVSVPAELLANVEKRGVFILNDAHRSPVPRSLRMLAVDVSLASFSVVYLVWCARMVGFLP